MPIPPATPSSYPQRKGNTAIPYIDGEKAMGRIFDAIVSAQSSVWLTMCYVKIDFVIPILNKSIIEIITEVSQKENMDVRILAWRSKAISGDFQGTKKEFRDLKDEKCKAKIRWDSNTLGCHHQKMFVIDGETAFVGGINMNKTNIDSSAHDRKDPHPTHDYFCEVKGPAVEDIIHNFVQRWNEASERNKKYGSYPQDPKPGNLSCSSGTRHQGTAGNVKVQVTRTIPSNVYQDISGGEYSIRESYLNAIKHAEEYIYLENQYFFDKVSHYSVIRALIHAAYRGVKVFIVLPGNPDFTKLLSSQFLKEVKDHPNIYVYTLATSYDGDKEGKPGRKYNDIYIHAKLFIVDDAWYSIGSANISYQSLRTDSEINVTIWDAEGARKLRQDIWKEHLEYSADNTMQYNQEVIVDGNIGEAFEQWWWFARANRYCRETGVEAENRLMPLDIKKYTPLKRRLGYVKDIYEGTRKQLSSVIGSLIEIVREHT